MPFGLKNAGATFQRLMDKVFYSLDFVFIYLDDMIIASCSEAEHLSHLAEVMRRLQLAGLVLNLEKCAFSLVEVEFLGHVISVKGFMPMKKHTEAIKKFPSPTDQKSLMSFLGLVNFYRRFITSAAAILLPLTNALIGGSKAPWYWSPEMRWSFLSA